MTVIYRDAADMNVAVRVIYANESDELFYDANCTEGNEVADTDLFNLFVKGVVCVKDGTYFKAVSYNEDTGISFGFPEAEEEDTTENPDENNVG